MRTVFTAALSLVVALPLAAQFEGTITLKTDDASLGGAVQVTQSIKGHRVAYTSHVQQMGGIDAHIVIDQDAQTMTMMMPMTGAMAGMAAAMPDLANAKGIYTIATTKQAADAVNGSGAAPTFKDLGTSETLAGYKCEDYQMTDGKTVMNMCMAKELGSFGFSMGAFGGRRGAGGNWMQRLGTLGFPLKTWSPDGKVVMEVTQVQKGSVPESAFAIPDGYKDMSSMMGMLGGRGNRGGGGGR